MNTKERKALLNEMKLTQLRDLAKNYAIKGATALSKEEIIVAIMKFEKANPLTIIKDQPQINNLIDENDELVDLEGDDEDDDYIDVDEDYDDELNQVEDLGYEEDLTVEKEDFRASKEFDELRKQILSEVDNSLDTVPLEQRPKIVSRSVETIQTTSLEDLQLNDIIENGPETEIVTRTAINAPKIVTTMKNDGNVIPNSTWIRLRETSFPDGSPYLQIHINWAKWFNNKKINPKDFLAKNPNHQWKKEIAQLINSIEQ